MSVVGDAHQPPSSGVALLLTLRERDRGIIGTGLHDDEAKGINVWAEGRSSARGAH